MSQQMLRQTIRQLGAIPSSDSEAGLRKQLSLLHKENDHGQEAEEGQTAQAAITGTEEAQESKEGKAQEPEESPSGEESSTDA